MSSVFIFLFFSFSISSRRRFLAVSWNITIVSKDGQTCRQTPRQKETLWLPWIPYGKNSSIIHVSNATHLSKPTHRSGSSSEISISVSYKPEPYIKLDETSIKMVGEANFSGISNCQLLFRAHVKYIKKVCNKALKLLRIICPFGYRSFSYQGPVVWNSLPTDLKLIFPVLI